MRFLVAALAALAAAALAAPAALAQDSDAPPGALPHWLPTEDWVYQHWLPFDEGRLYRLLRADRGAIWRHLRDDAAHDLEQLARRRGYRPRELARLLVAPRGGGAALESRALRVITQGHLSQHIIFHSLHQTAVPRRSRWIFGTRNARFLALRRAEASPLQIGRLHGRTTAQMYRRSVAALRAMARRGVRLRAMSRGQARLLLDRQVRQIPRWLGQSRYNGPPPTIGPKKALLPPADFANNPQISDDGRVVVWDAYRAKIPEARTRGEITVRGAHVDEGTTFTVAGRAAATGLPASAYNASLAADGTAVAFERAEGNLNFAKRYGEMRVDLRPLPGLRPTPISHPEGPAGPSRTAYEPTVSADGRQVAFAATDAGERSRNGVWVADRVTGAERRLTGRAVFEPRITDDGRSLVFTDAGGRVRLRDVATGATALVSRGPAGPANAEAGEPAPSADGRVVAFTSRASNLGVPGRQSRVYVRTPTRTEAVSPSTVFAFEPAISADGRFVAYAARPRARAALRSEIRLHDRWTGGTTTISRGGFASEPAVSADGRRVVFTSTVADPAKPAGLAGVFLHDVDAGRTRLLSTHTPVAQQSGAPRDSRPLLCPLARGHALAA